MGGAVRDAPLIPALSVEEEAGLAAAELFERQERRVRSPRLNGILTAGALALLGLACALLPSPWLGGLTRERVAIVIGGWWLSYELATIAFHVFGPRHPLFLFSRSVDHFCRTVAILVQLTLSGAAAVLFLFASVARAFTFRPYTERELRGELLLGGLAHVSTALVCVLLGEPGSGALVMLALVAVILAQLQTGRAAIRTLRARVERDALERDLLGRALSGLPQRLAREVHDGVGADVMALLLQLRHESSRVPEAGELAKEAQGLLEDLRSLVRSLERDK